MTLHTQAHHLDHEASLYAATGMRRQARDCADQARLLRQLAREADEFRRRYPHVANDNQFSKAGAA